MQIAVNKALWKFAGVMWFTMNTYINSVELLEIRPKQGVSYLFGFISIGRHLSLVMLVFEKVCEKIKYKLFQRLKSWPHIQQLILEKRSGKRCVTIILIEIKEFKVLFIAIGKLQEQDDIWWIY